MCGIAGQIPLQPHAPIEPQTVREMIAMLRHRGPEKEGFYFDPHAGLGHSRLSIIDLSGGDQPISNEDETLWIVFNGEIFNYIELRELLEKSGHTFRTNTDTEVLLHLYEQDGIAALNRLNGQFAFLIWDRKNRVLLAARDRVGVRPLFYTTLQGSLYFASEIKAFLRIPGFCPQMDPGALAEVFSFWAPQGGKTAFNGVMELNPGHFMTVSDGKLTLERFWQPDFSQIRPVADVHETVEVFEKIFNDAVRIRLRSDVPVGTYLSGGLDSSLTTAIAARLIPNVLETFSISFEQAQFDEGGMQILASQAIGTHHHDLRITDRMIGEVFPQVVLACETPILRTAPAPMYLLAQMVHQHGLKVVLTGEGADEFLGGYDLFKEMKVRRFWAAQPDSELRAQLLYALYPNMRHVQQRSAFFLGFFRKGLEQASSPFFSHLPRWTNTARNHRFLAQQTLSAANHPDLSLPQGFDKWTALAKAQYLEIVTFMSPYLLSSQGDRMAMSHSVEGRYPFLDANVMAFAMQLPDSLKLPGLGEKWILRQIAHEYLPEPIWRRRKQPYRAPIHKSFFGVPQPAYLDAALSPANLQRTGLFDVNSVVGLFRKAREASELSEVEEMAVTGILSAQLLALEFTNLPLPPLTDPALTRTIVFQNHP